MFKQLLASVGIGAARVETHLCHDSVVPGGLLEGEVHIQGGSVEQTINEIYLYIATKFKREVGDSDRYEECRLIRHLVAPGFTLQPHEKRTVPLSVPVPYQTPVTIGRQEVFIRTGLDISLALNPRDWDRLEVRPHPLMDHVLDALRLLGFQLYQVDCEFAPHLNLTYPFAQEFEFRPTGKFSRWLDELEVVFQLTADRLDVYLEMDKRARSLGGWLNEALDTDERYARLRLTPARLQQSPQDLAEQIDDLLQRYLS